jgi:hypothetical protein
MTGALELGALQFAARAAFNCPGLTLCMVSRFAGRLIQSASCSSPEFRGGGEAGSNSNCIAGGRGLSLGDFARPRSTQPSSFGELRVAVVND